MSPSGEKPGAGRSWNLGKEVKRPEKKKPEPPEEEKAPAPEARKVVAPPPKPERVAPPKPVEPEDDEEEFEETPDPLPPGRQLPPPRSPREFLQHPIGLATIGVVASLLVIIGLFRWHGGGGPQEIPASALPTTDDLVLGYLGFRDHPLVPAATVEPEEMREARLVLAMGQVAERAGAFARAQAENGAPIEAYDFVPPAIEQAPIPPEGAPDHLHALLTRDEAGMRAVEIGREVLRRAQEANAAPDHLARLGALMIEEGRLASRRARGDTSGPSRPSSPPMDNREASDLIPVLFGAELGSAIQSVRLRTFDYPPEQ